MRGLAIAASFALLAAPADAACTNPMKREVMMFPGFVETPLPETVPEIAYQSANGGTGSLSDLRGKPSLVGFWFPECPGCQYELPSVNAMLGQYKDEDRINFLSLSIMGGRQSVGSFLDAKGYAHVDANIDPGAAIFTDLCLAATPVHVVLDREARMVAAFVGPQDWTGAKAAEFLNRLIETGAP